ncbi:MAG: hypothetical protein QXS81_04970 [Candidatus Micrarchaeaceae archaeon]
MWFDDMTGFDGLWMIIAGIVIIVLSILQLHGFLQLMITGLGLAMNILGLTIFLSVLESVIIRRDIDE